MKKVLFLTAVFTATQMFGMSEQNVKTGNEPKMLAEQVNEEIASVLFSPSQNAVVCNFSFGEFKDMTVVESFEPSFKQAFDAQEQPIALHDSLERAHRAITAKAARCLKKDFAEYGEISANIAITLLRGNQYILHFGAI